MSDYKHKPDTGTLFRNTFKVKPTQPDYTGQYASPNGEIREFAAWLNEKGYISVRFNDLYEKQESA